MAALFGLGRLTCTVGALQLIERLEEFPYLTRHSGGDWGEVDAHDRRANDRALKTGERLFSSYETPQGRIWIITEVDRSSTTILLPSEY